jgi:hypothetical protein
MNSSRETEMSNNRAKKKWSTDCSSSGTPSCASKRYICTPHNQVVSEVQNRMALADQDGKFPNPQNFDCGYVTSHKNRRRILRGM